MDFCESPQDQSFTMLAGMLELEHILVDQTKLGGMGGKRLRAGCAE